MIHHSIGPLALSSIASPHQQPRLTLSSQPRKAESEESAARPIQTHEAKLCGAFPVAKQRSHFHCHVMLTV